MTMPGMAATLDTIAEQPGVEAARAESLHQVTWFLDVCIYELNYIHWSSPGNFMKILNADMDVGWHGLDVDGGWMDTLFRRPSLNLIHQIDMVLEDN